jgi:hypothetical protein
MWIGVAILTTDETLLQTLRRCFWHALLGSVRLQKARQLRRCPFQLILAPTLRQESHRVVESTRVPGLATRLLWEFAATASSSITPMDYR